MTTARSLSEITLTQLKDVVLQQNFWYYLPKRKSRLGRRGYDKLSLFLAYILKLRERIPSDTELAKKLQENRSFQQFCGFHHDQTPSHDTLSRFFKLLTIKRLQSIFGSVDRQLIDLEVFNKDEIAYDATDILSNGRNRHNPDQDAGWGHKSDNERFHGYWAHFLVGTTSELLRAVRVTPANIHQSETAVEMIDRLTPEIIGNATLFFGDSALDDKKTYAAIIEQEMAPLISYNPRKSKIKDFLKLKRKNWRHRALGPVGIELWRKYKHKRGSVERYNSTFKYLLGGRVIPTRGLLQVTKYVLGLTILSQLCSLAFISQKSSHPQPIPHLLSNFLTVP